MEVTAEFDATINTSGSCYELPAPNIEHPLRNQMEAIEITRLPS